MNKLPLSYHQLNDRPGLLAEYVRTFDAVLAYADDSIYITLPSSDEPEEPMDEVQPCM